MLDKKQLLHIALSILLLSFFLACYEHQEGCQDVNSLDYDVNADKSCEDCCSYPDLLLKVDHVFDGELFDTTIFFELNNHSYKIASLNFFLSNFSLHNTNAQEEVHIEESISVKKQGTTAYESLYFPVAKVNLGRTEDYVLGTFKYADTYDKIGFDFGISEEVNHAEMDMIISQNALYQNQDSMYIDSDNGFYFFKMDLETIEGEYRRIGIKGDDHLISLMVDKTFDFNSRADRLINIEIDYNKWFENIDFEDENVLNIEKILLENIPKAFILK